jgi:site-specific DNA-methyltransferase (cytosine-N4-specific)
MNKTFVKSIDSIHPFPAKYTVDMVEGFINKYTKEGEIVLDPFVGSGTTLLAATLNNRIGIGSDINPIGYLISKYKIAFFSKNDIKKLIEFCEQLTEKIEQNDYSYLNNKIIQYESIYHWFKKDIIKILTFIKCQINIFFACDKKLEDICFMAFSSIIVTVSNQESDTRYAAIIKKNLTKETVVNLFLKKLKNIIDIANLDVRRKNILDSSNVYLINSKNVNKKIKNKVDFLITSPPYPNTYDYYLYHKHRMMWLNYDYKPVMQEEIGSRREYSSLKKPIQNFERDLFEVFFSCDKVLKDGAYVMIIIGDGKIRGEAYDSLEVTLRIGKKLLWKNISNDHTLLDNTSRSFTKSFRTKGKKEHYVLFTK